MPTLFRWADVQLEKITEMVSRKEIRGGTDVLVQTYLKKGALIPVHEHSGPQWIYVLQGALSLVVGEAAVTLREGELVRVPAGVPHQGEALDDTFVMDIRK